MVFYDHEIRPAFFSCKFSSFIATFLHNTSARPRWNFVALITSLPCLYRLPHSAGPLQVVCTAYIWRQFSSLRWRQFHFESYARHFFHLKLSDYHAFNITDNVILSIVFRPWYAAASADVSGYSINRSLMFFQNIPLTFSDVTSRTSFISTESTSTSNLYWRNVYLTVQLIPPLYI